MTHRAITKSKTSKSQNQNLLCGYCTLSIVYHQTHLLIYLFKLISTPYVKRHILITIMEYLVDSIALHVCVTSQHKLTVMEQLEIISINTL